MRDCPVPHVLAVLAPVSPAVPVVTVVVRPGVAGVPTWVTAI